MSPSDDPYEPCPTTKTGTTGVIMKKADGTEESTRRMRDEAERLEQEAAHATDPAERQRLTEQALRVRETSEEVNGPGSGTMDPM
ncbi:DUF6381 family protein [Streptomyces sp. NPDC002990]